MKGRFFIGIIMFLMLLTGMIPSMLPVGVAAPSTAITITKYTCDGTTVLGQTTVDYVWMEANLPVWGDGVSHYYHQGPTFDPANLWDSGIPPEPPPGETVNVDSNDLGAAVGSDVRDLCAQVGGAPAGSRIEIKAVDSFSKSFAADDINSMVGIRPIIAWKNDTYGGYVPAYSSGMRLIFFDEATNVDGKHVFSHWDMHETMSDTYWSYYNDGSTLWPSSKGLSVKNVDRIDIFDCDDSNPCTTDECMPGGGCRYTMVPNGLSCADEDVCNGDETCQSRTCTGGTPLADGTPCDDSDLCNGDEACQSGTCTAGTPLPDGTSCADSDLCNGDETCQSGTCTAGTRLNCNNSNVCTTDTCDPALGCQNTPVTDGTSCADSDLCNGDETCQSGTCTAGTPLADGISCADSDLCNGDETCQSGTCTAGTRLNCNDSNVCTTDTCDPVLGCQNTPVTDGTSCADSTVCNGDETCQAGACTGGMALNCNDSNPCTTDGCDPLFGCEHFPVANGTSCSDGNICNGSETCQAGECALGSRLGCNDANPCTDDSCDPQTGCVRQNNTALCDDGNACTTADACVGGACQPGTPLHLEAVAGLLAAASHTPDACTGKKDRRLSHKVTKLIASANKKVADAARATKEQKRQKLTGIALRNVEKAWTKASKLRGKLSPKCHAAILGQVELAENQVSCVQW